MRLDTSRQDTREYLFHDLSNGLKLLLVSNSDSVQRAVVNEEVETLDRSMGYVAAATLCVKVGSFSDPEDLPGLTNLMSRMLIHGISQFSDEGAPQYGTHTTLEYTWFHMHANFDRLDEELKHFSTQFVEPLFPSAWIEEILTDIDRSYGKQRLRDESIIRQFICSLAAKHSPYNRFHNGNKQSIMGMPQRSMEELQGRLIEHYRTHFSSHLMTLVVQSPQPMSVLESIVLDKFRRIPKIVTPDVNYAKYVDSFETPDFHRYHNVQSVNGKENLRMVWAIPSLRHAYRSHPLLILSKLIKNMNEGGLAFYLDENHFATDLDCDWGALCDFTNSRICTLVVIRMKLTQTGNRHIPEICCLVYDYLRYLSTLVDQSIVTPPHDGGSEQGKWNFLWNDDPHTFDTYVREVQLNQQHQFIDQSVFTPPVTTAWLANMLHRVSSQNDLYSGYSLIKETNFQVYNDLLTRLSKEEACIIHTCPDLMNVAGDDSTIRTERWFGTKYISKGVHLFSLLNDDVADQVTDLQAHQSWDDPSHVFGSRSSFPEIPLAITERQWQNQSGVEFSLPVKDKLIAEYFENLPQTNELKLPMDLNAKQERIRYRDYGSLWYQSCKHFERPKATFVLRVMPGLPIESVRKVVLLSLYVDYIQRTLDSWEKPELFKHMGQTIKVVDNAIEIRVTGLSEDTREYYYLILSRTFKRTIQMEVLEFNELLDNLTMKLQRGITSTKITGENILHVITHTPAFLLSEQLDMLESLTVFDLIAFSTQLLGQLRMTAYVVGDIEEEEIQSMYDRTVRSISCIPTLTPRETKPVPIPPGTHRLEQGISDTKDRMVYVARYDIMMDTAARAEAYNRALVVLISKEIATYFSHSTQRGIQTSVYYTRCLPRSAEGHAAIVTVIRAESQSTTAESLVGLLSAFWFRIIPQLIAGTEAMELQRMLTHVVGITRENLLNFFSENYIDPANQRALIVQLDPSSQSGVRKRLMGSKPIGRSNLTTATEAHVTRYMPHANFDHSAISKYPDLLALIHREFPEEFKPIMNVHCFKKKW